MSTTLEKFREAALSLARSGPIKDRLATAYRNHLASIDIDDLPLELREAFCAFSQSLTRERPLLRGEDACRATVRKMSNDEADAAASCIVRMYGIASSVEVTWVRTAKVPGNVVPLYAAEA